MKRDNDIDGTNIKYGKEVKEGTEMRELLL